jgi:hypothetical protein
MALLRKDREQLAPCNRARLVPLRGVAKTCPNDLFDGNAPRDGALMSDAVAGLR